MLVLIFNKRQVCSSEFLLILCVVCGPVLGSPSLATARSVMGPGTRGWAEAFAVAPPSRPQHKVVIVRGAHGVKHVGVVRNMELFPVAEHLIKTKVVAAEVLHVVFLQRPLNDLRGVVLARQQNAFVDVAVADALHTDADDAGVGDLFVVEWLRGRAGTRGRGRFWTGTKRGRTQVWMGRAAGRTGQTRTWRRHGEVLSDVVEGAGERLKFEPEWIWIGHSELLHVRAAGSRGAHADLVTMCPSRRAVTARS